MTEQEFFEDKKDWQTNILFDAFYYAYRVTNNMTPEIKAATYNKHIESLWPIEQYANKIH